MAVELGTAYVSIMPSTKDLAKPLTAAFESMEGPASSSGKGIGAVLFGAAAGVGMSLMNKAIGTIADSMGSAIARVDTLNSFPKVMENLGYSSSDAAASIEKMSDKLQGLPTSLDTMAGAVQVMAPLTSSLDEATDISLALNNALIAGGKSTEEQSNAMAQYVQMLSTGKVDMQAWKSMVSAMPGQMDQLSKSLLGADANQTDLYAAMQDGTVTFDDFNQELLKLNDSGLDGFASFQTQAQDATGGIGTSLANLGTAITRNLANVIQELKPQIDGVVAGLTSFANAAGPVVIAAVQGIGDAFAWVGDNWEWLGPLVVGVGAAAAAFGIWQGAIALWSGVTKVASAIQVVFNAVMAANPIMLIVLAIAALVAGLIYFFTQTELGQEIWANFTQFLSEAWTNITTFLSEAWTNIVNFFTSGQDTVDGIWTGLWQGISDFFISMWEGIKSFFSTALQWIIDMFLTWHPLGIIISNWDAIAAFFVGLWNNITSFIGGAIQGIADTIAAVTNWISSTWNNVWTGIKFMFLTIWNNIVTAAVGFVARVQTTFNNVVTFVSSIPSRIVGFFSGIGSSLINSGRALIQGFLDGIMAGFNKAKDFVSNGLAGIRNLFPFSPAKEGPFSGRGWVAYSGLSLGETFTDSIVRGLNDGKSDVARALGGVQGEFSGVAESGMRLSTSVADGYASQPRASAVTQDNTIYMQERDPRMVLRQLGRELNGALA